VYRKHQHSPASNGGVCRGRSMNLMDWDGNILECEKRNLVQAIKEYGPKLLELKTE